MTRALGTVLVVDDDPSIRRGLAAELAAAGYETLEASDGEEGARLASEHEPDLVLTDLAMPVADGFDLAGPCAEVIVSVMAWAAKMELLARNERIAAARERVSAEGGAWGRPAAMTAAQLETAKRMKAEGATVRAIAKAVGVSKTIVGRAVKGSTQATAAT